MWHSQPELEDPGGSGEVLERPEVSWNSSYPAHLGYIRYPWRIAVVEEPEEMVTNIRALPKYLPYTSAGQVAAQVAIVVVIMATTLFGNSVMCYTVYRMPKLRTATNIFTTNLGVTDLAVALFVLPVWIVSLAAGATSAVTPFPDTLCQVTAFITVTLLLVSVATLAGISLDRYLSICYPLRYPMKVTSRRVVIALAYIWIQSLIVASTPFFGWGQYRFRPQTIAICSPIWVGHRAHSIFMLTVGLGTPFAIMLFSYIRIIQAARKQARSIEQMQLQLVNPWLNFGPPPSPISTPDTASLQAVDYPAGWDRRHDLRRLSVRLQRWRQDSKLRSRRRKRRKAAKGNAVFSNVSKNLKTLKTVFIVVGKFCFLD